MPTGAHSDVISAAALTPGDIAAVLAEHDEARFALAETRRTAGVLAARALPTVHRLDSTCLSRLTLRERDELPASFDAGLSLVEQRRAEHHPED